jgi:hypothetical protein
MNRLGFSFVMGLIILLIGATLAVDLVFDVHLPLVRIVLAVLFMAWGARMVVHAMARRDRFALTGEAWLADREFKPHGEIGRDARFDVAFGRGMVDLTQLDPPVDDVTITVDTLFGAAVVKVDPAIAYDVHGSSVFGEVRMPDRSSTAMGNLDYRSPNDARPRLHLRLNALFGACQVVEAAPTTHA